MAIYDATVRAVRDHPLEHDPEFGELEVEVVEFRAGREARVACGAEAHADTWLLASLLKNGEVLLQFTPAA